MDFLLNISQNSHLQDYEGKSDAYKALMSRPVSKVIVPGSHMQKNSKTAQLDQKEQDNYDVIRLVESEENAEDMQVANFTPQKPLDDFQIDSCSTFSIQASRQPIASEDSEALNLVFEDSQSHSDTDYQEILKILNLSKVGDNF